MTLYTKQVKTALAKKRTKGDKLMLREKKKKKYRLATNGITAKCYKKTSSIE